MGDIDVKVSANWDRWTRGFADLGDQIEMAAGTAFQEAGEVFFSHTQQYAHVLTGDMLSTGRIEEHEGPSEVGVDVLYGGIPGKATGRVVDYAKIENDRGGSHAFMDRAWESTERIFSAALPAAWAAVTQSWR